MRNWRSLLVILLLTACWKDEDDSRVGLTSVTGSEEYEVTVVFLGLMSWDLPADMKTATVIIPAIKKDITAGNGNNKVHKHVAYLLATKTAMPLNLNAHHRFQKPDEGTDVFHYLPLKGEMISVSDDNRAASSSSPLTYKNTACGKCPDKTTMTYMCWLSSMKDVYGVSAEPPRSSKHFKTRPDDDDIAARTVIQYGGLAAHVVAYPNKPATLWRFATPTNSGNNNDYSTERALAQEVYWTFKAKGAPFILNLLEFKPNPQLRQVAFMPKDGKLMIFIGNTTEQDSGPVGTPSRPKRDDHYSIYHKFVRDNTNGDGKIPFPYDAQTCPADDGGTPVVFPPTLNVVEAQETGRSLAATFRYGGGPNPTPGALNCTGNQWP